MARAAVKQITKTKVPLELEEGDMPMNTFNPKKPFKAKIKSVKTLTGPKVGATLPLAPPGALALQGMQALSLKFKKCRRCSAAAADLYPCPRMNRFIVVPTNPAFLGTTYGPHLYTLIPLKDEPPNCSTTWADAPN
jgi:hypothetical protein